MHSPAAVQPSCDRTHRPNSITFILANRSDKDKETAVPPFSGLALFKLMWQRGDSFRWLELGQQFPVCNQQSQLDYSLHASKSLTTIQPSPLTSRSRWAQGTANAVAQLILWGITPCLSLPFLPASPMCRGARAGASCSPGCSSLHSFCSDWQTNDRTISGHLMPSVRL